MFLVTLIVFLIIFSILVLVHEFGHFLAAKISGVKVEEFGLGFPPRIFAKKKGGTIFSLNLIPFGGFVKLLGLEEEKKDSHSFSAKSVWSRAFILISGVFMNFVFAIVVFTLGFSIGMSPIVSSPSAYSQNSKNEIILVQVQSGSAAAKAGLASDETILAGQDANGWQNFNNIDDLQSFTKDNQGKPVTLKLKINGSEEEKQVTLDQGEAPLGVALTEMGIVKLRPDKAFVAATREVWAVSKVIVFFLGDVIKQLFVKGQLSSEIGGPVAIFSYTGQAVKFGFPVILQFVGLLSINLMLLNFVPFPALDGGKLVFIAMEAIFRKKLVRIEVENIIHLIGLILLILLIVVVTYRDIIKIVIR